MTEIMKMITEMRSKIRYLYCEKVVPFTLIQIGIHGNKCIDPSTVQP